MSGNTININIQISGTPNGVPHDIPLQVEEQEAQNHQLVQSTANAAERALLQLHRSHYIAIVKSANVSKKLLKHILTQTIPNTTFRVISLVGKILVLAGV